MPRFRVAAAVVLALALMIASCSDSADQSESDVAQRLQQLEVAYKDGEKARQSIDEYGLEVSEATARLTTTPPWVKVSAATTWSIWAATTS